MMIQNFDNVILENLGFEPLEFDRDYFQWTYQFKKNNLKLDFTYSIDKIISTYLYFNEILIASNFASGLSELSIENNIIIATLSTDKLYRKLKLAPYNITIKWSDEFIL
ncbi:hypothetical protein Ga0061079_1022 [Apibacter mensalis]|uniref:Uncharacterized protein n=1 Tax=Apibacter mensalis TaxID=1586267 RepID=A0A0X3AMU8_9FLAO|nr:hypothetical protein [Apibacter mensalis]CVK15457.1 hypothetical protein Ga0061079_1022 [Apibacter mensalis]